MGTTRFGRTLGIGGFCAGVALSAQAQARTYSVSTTSSCTLRLAVQAANTSSAQGSCLAGDAGSNKIILAAGTYALTSPLTITKSLSIEGAGVGSTIVRSNLSTGTEFITVQPGSVLTDVTLKGMTIDKASTQTAPTVTGVYVYGLSDGTATLSVQSCRVAGHTWAGLYANNATLNVADTTVEGNSSLESGGGVHVRASLPLRGSFMCDRTTINGNTSADSGGGVYFAGNQSSQVRDTTISGNSAVQGGGVAYASPDWSSGYFNLIQTTVAHNSASGSGGGLYTPPFSASYDPNVVLVASIVANNSAGASPDTDAHVHAITASLVGNTAGIDIHQGNASGENRYDIDPLLDPVLRSWGGPTKVHRLLPGSVALDIVNQWETSSTTDQRGVKRPQLGSTNGDMFDMGAYEESRLETETLQVASKTAAVTHTIVSNANYSNGQGTNLQSTANNQFVTYATPAATTGGTYNVVIGFKKGSSGGKFQVATSQALVGPYTNLAGAQDGFAGSSSWTSVNLGSVSLPALGTSFIRFSVTGTSGAGRQIFPDFIQLTKQ